LASYPEIQIDLRLSDRFVDIAAEGIDVAIRFGDLQDSSLIRKHLGQPKFVLCASPKYLEKHGTPTELTSLTQHNCMRYVFDRQPSAWEFLIEDTWQTIPVSGSFYADNSEALKAAAIAGLGIARLLEFQIKQALEDKQLIALLTDYKLTGLTVQALYTHRRNLSPRVQVFLQFLSQYCKAIALTTLFYISLFYISAIGKHLVA
ncbi:MAG: substrate binding domain-containing protein, partial [Cyanobacteria bacterium J06650_10]